MRLKRSLLVVNSPLLGSRIRSQNKGNKAYSFVIMMDNTRRGEAISCVEILKLLSKSL